MDRYSKGAIALHWIIAALILFEIGLGWRMEGKPGAELFAVYQLHKSVGITILLLSLIRLGWRVIHKPPAYPAHLKRWERRLSTGVHHVFYLLMIGLPLSGWLIVSSSKTAIPTFLYGLIPWPHFPGVAANKSVNGGAGIAHHLLVDAAYLMLFLHIAGALKHHLIDRSQLAARMLPVAANRLSLALAAALILVSGAFAFGNRVVLVTPHSVSAPAVTASPAASSVAAPAVNEAEPVADEPVAKEDVGQNETATTSVAPLSSKWTVERASSKIGFATSWNGTTLTGGFGRWSASIEFDPASLAKAHARVEIDVASVSASDGSAESALPGADWFDAASHPKAVFESSDFRLLGGDHYEARGTLSIRGIPRPLTLPFTLKIDGDKAQMTGTALLDRLAYGIGQGEWTATDAVPANVTVNLRVTARRK